MGSDIPKQYTLLDGKPVLYYSLAAFEKSRIDSVILVVGSQEVNFVRSGILSDYPFKKIEAVIEGGAERYHSVYCGLKQAAPADYILIHDGARPLVDNAMIERAIESVLVYGACAAGVPVKDTIKISTAGKWIESTPRRETLWNIQTPQAFAYDLIKNAYDELFDQNGAAREPVTDDAMVLERLQGQKVHLYEGSYQNIKITTREDLNIAELFLNQ